MSKQFLCACLVGLAAGACPTVTPKADLNLTEYTRASWYIQEQQVTGYLELANFYCTVATYNETLAGKPASVPLCKEPKCIVREVYNYENKGGVNGKASTPGTSLCARAKDASDPARLLVAPCFLPNALAGDYWVLAAGPSNDNYEWAIISGGNPTVQFADGCTTKETGENESGLWLFHRKQVAPAADLTAMKQLLTGIGFTTSRLHPVTQQGCKYDGATLKM